MRSAIRLDEVRIVVYCPRYLQMGFEALGYKCSIPKLRRLRLRVTPESMSRLSYRPTKAQIARGEEAIKQGIAGLHVHQHGDVVAILPWPDPNAPKRKRVFVNPYTKERTEIEV